MPDRCLKYAVKIVESWQLVGSRSVKPPGKHLQQYDREPGRMPSLQVVRRKKLDRFVDFVSTRPSFKRSSKTLRPSCSASIKLGGMLSVNQLC